MASARFLKSAFAFQDGSNSMGPPSLPTTQTRKLNSAVNLTSWDKSLPSAPEPRILRSAFIPRRLSAITPAWTHTCEMITVTFHRTTATYSAQDGLLVRFSTQRDTTETIQIAKDHESPDDVGFIGKGYTKRGIYVRWFSFFDSP